MNNRAAQVYGYAVCFITVIVMLIAIKQVVDAAFDLTNPIRAENGGFGRMGRTITSFDLYKADAKNQRGMNAPNAPAKVDQGTQAGNSRAAADTLSDAELRRLYDAERQEVTENVRFRAIRSLVGNLLLMAVAGALFVIHWRWLKRRETAPALGASSTQLPS